MNEVLDRFVEHGQGDLAERLAAERATATSDPSILRWEQTRFARQGDPAAALRVARDVFAILPSVALYEEIRGYAQKLNSWEATRAELRATLQAQHRRHLLVETSLADGDVDGAIAEVLATPAAGPTVDSVPWLGDLALRVAAAAETTRPRDAIEIYLRGARRLIDSRGRTNYQDASVLLHDARRLYQGLGEGDVWRRFTTQLRNDNRKLRVLLEELDRAGL
jgi:uncharacterized Zn finger protein